MMEQQNIKSVQDPVADINIDRDHIVDTKQVVTFKLGKEEYATNIMELKEIIKLPTIIAIPGAHPYLRGMFNLRGQVIVVIDLQKRFGLQNIQANVEGHVIIVEVEGTLFGITVDEVTGVMRVPSSSIKPAPSAIGQRIKTDYLDGVIVINNRHTENNVDKSVKKAPSESRLLLLLSLEKMLSEKELLEAGDVASNQQISAPLNQQLSSLMP